MQSAIGVGGNGNNINYIFFARVLRTVRDFSVNAINMDDVRDCAYSPTKEKI